jgi:hypothetical protein
MAQATPRQKAKSAKGAKGAEKADADSYGGFPIANLKSPTGMDGGNRK